MRFFNTLSGQLEEFKPLVPGEIKLYTCGPTVYDFAHIGNFRTFVFEDLLRRYLEYKGFHVTHVMNVTDVDDKTIAGANRDGKKLGEFTETYTQAFNDDLRTLNILPPAKQPRATAEIGAMLDLIAKLIANKTAYESDGSVYYRISSFPNYGKLSKKDLEQNIAGARVDHDEYDKEIASDFVLWKRAKEGEPAWDSPWGKGRPGWHIECSAMSMKYLGATFDLHAGGEDLIFPHHENEIAQSEGATKKTFVRYWLHAKHLLVNGEKMSKSKGNFFTLRDLIAKGHDPMAIRYVLAATHYRSSLNFTTEGVHSAKEALRRIRDFWFERKAGLMDRTHHSSGKASVLLESAKQKFNEAMEDDLNTPQALGALFHLIKEINVMAKEEISAEENKQIDLFLKSIDQVLGIFGELILEEEIPAEVQKLVLDRQSARTGRDFKRADEIRNQIKQLGYVIEDAPDGVKIKKLL